MKLSAQSPRRPAPEGRYQLSEAEQSQDGEQDDAGGAVLAGHDKRGKDEDRQGGADHDHPDPEASGRERRQVHGGEATPWLLGEAAGRDDRGRPPRSDRVAVAAAVGRASRTGGLITLSRPSRPVHRRPSVHVDGLYLSIAVLPQRHDCEPLAVNLAVNRAAPAQAPRRTSDRQASLVGINAGLLSLGSSLRPAGKIDPERQARYPSAVSDREGSVTCVQSSSSV